MAGQPLERRLTDPAQVLAHDEGAETAIATLAACPACGATVGAEATFCEACGHELSTPAPTATVPSGAADAGHWLSSAGAPTACPGCGGATFDADEYCETCGQRRPAALDHRELDLGAVAGVTDRGIRHARNEDAMGIGAAPGVLLAVVCDGVSSSSRPDAASHAAVQAATPALLAELAEGNLVGQAITTAARAAQAGAVLAAGSTPGPNPPSSTFVCAVLVLDTVTVGWVGDSRAYWLPTEGEAVCLTSDDSLAGRMAAAGVEAGDIPQDRSASALVRWMGADAPDAAPHLRTFTPNVPGRVLVVSDGVFRYRPDAVDLAAVTPDKPPLETARDLVAFALEQGGHDNITAVVLTYPPADPAQVLAHDPPAAEEDATS
jgi:serine/threonine protein phosphatase PrpC